MTSIAKKFAVGFSAAALLAALLNLLPYLRTRVAYNGDGFEVIGFPFVFRRFGGIAGTYQFRVGSLLADVSLALAFALLVGYIYSRVHQRDSQ